MKVSVLICATAVIVSGLLLNGCGLFDSGRGKVISNKARLEKSLSGGFGKRAATATSAILIDGQHRSTPSNLNGDLCYAILALGDLGPGMFSMVWLAPSNTFPEGPRSGTASTVIFDLSAPATISGQILVPSSEKDMPSRKEIIRAELSFNYVDATFEAGTPAQTYKIRTIYATTASAADASGTMYKGDKLILLPGETSFRWANANGTSQSREEVADGLYQDTTVSKAVWPGDGNADYVPVTANFTQTVPVSYDQITNTNKLWTLEFILDNAIVWSVDPATLSEPQEILNAFRLKFGPNQSTTREERDDGIRSTLRIE